MLTSTLLGYGRHTDRGGGQAFYTAFGQWNDGAPMTAFSVQPGDKLQVTIEDEGSSGYLVEISDEHWPGSSRNQP